MFVLGEKIVDAQLRAWPDNAPQGLVPGATGLAGRTYLFDAAFENQTDILDRLILGIQKLASAKRLLFDRVVEDIGNVGPS